MKNLFNVVIVIILLILISSCDILKSINEDDPETPSSSCPQTVTYSGKTYNTVQINNQCWFKENLNVGTMITSNSGNDNQTNNGSIEKYCYNNDPAYCDTLGGLYQWEEAMQYSTQEGAKGICPDGWHIPTITELHTLNDAVGTDANALKALGQGTGSGIGTNTSGFSALLAGARDYESGSFSAFGYTTLLWSSTKLNDTRANHFDLHYHIDYAVFKDDNYNVGYSIRCLKD